MASSVQKIAPVRGKLGVLLPGMGAVSSTLIAGVELYKKGLGDLVGSITQLQTIRLGKRYEGRRPLIRNFAPIDKPENIVFGGWDIFPDDMHQAAIKAGVLPADRLEPIKKELAAIKPFTGVFDPKYIKNLKGTHVKKGKTKWDLAEQVMEDIDAFKRRHKLDRVVLVWCGSTEILPERSKAHRSLAA